MRIHTHTSTHTHTDTEANTHTQTHTRTYAHTHTYSTYTYIHAHAYIHTHTTVDMSIIFAGNNKALPAPDSRQNGQISTNMDPGGSEGRYKQVLGQASERYRQSKRQQLIDSLSSAYQRAVQQTSADAHIANSYSRRLLDRSGQSIPGSRSPHSQFSDVPPATHQEARPTAATLDYHV